MIYAGASSDKSLFALYLVNFLLEKQALQKIYYCDGDNGLSTLKNRKLDIMLENHKNLEYYQCDDSSKYAFFNKLAKSAIDFSHCLIVIDSIRNFIQGDFTKDNAITSFFAPLQELRNKGATIIFLHHQPKQCEEDNQIYKGSTAFIDSCDHAYYLSSKIIKENEEFIILLEPKKFRIANIKAQAFRLNASHLSLESVDYLINSIKEGKEQNTIDFTQEILRDHPQGLKQEELKTFLEKEEEKQGVNILGRNNRWKFLEKYNNIFLKIERQARENGGKPLKIYKPI